MARGGLQARRQAAMAFLIDADWVINALAARRGAIAAIRALASQGISISRVTVGEIYEGAFGLPDPHLQLTRLRHFLGAFDVLDLNDDIMERFASTRAFLRRKGRMIPDFDIVLAATALHYDLTVLTYDVAHFQRIPGLKVYSAI